MASPATLDAPSASEVSAIADLKDAPIRNLWITWSYYRLNRAMVDITGNADLTWCGFAVWASKTAGAFIRQQEAGPIIDKWIDGATAKASPVSTMVARVVGIHREKSVESSTAPGWFSLRGFARKVIGQVGDAIGAGNQEVFRHIAPPFAQLIELWQARGGVLSQADRATLLQAIADHDARALHPSDSQHDYLHRAFTAMLDALASADPRTRAQLMLQANALIGCAEQTRVQPYIEQSMSDAIDDLFHTDLRSHLRRRYFSPIAGFLHWLMRDLARAMNVEFQDLSTKWMMTLNVPGASLHLGENVPPLANGQMYPPPLASLEAPQPTELLEQLKATDAAHCAAQDWVKYDQRMRYIGVLFRSRQQEPSLWDAPFTAAQIAQLQAGRLPDGSL